MGYGVIGNTKVSGSFVLGSSPGIPANLLTEVAAPSYSGLVLRPLTAATPVQIRLGSPLGKSLDSLESRLFVYACLFQEGIKSEKPHVFETHVASRRYRGSGIGNPEPTVPMPQQKQRSPPQAQHPQQKRSGSATEPAKQTQYPEHDAPYATCRPGNEPQSDQPPAYPGT